MISQFLSKRLFYLLMLIFIFLNSILIYFDFYYLLALPLVIIIGFLYIFHLDIIFLIIVTTLLNFLAYNEYKKIGLTRNQILFRYLMLTIHAFLLSTFVYSMCKRCRGLESILILILVSIIQGVLTMAPFFGKISAEIKKLEGDSKVRAKLTEGMYHNKRY